MDRYDLQEVAPGKWEYVAGTAVTLLMAGSAFAVTQVDYVSIVSAITAEIAGAIAAGVTLVGLIVGARAGVRFLKSVFAK